VFIFLSPARLQWLIAIFLLFQLLPDWPAPVLAYYANIGLYLLIRKMPDYRGTFYFEFEEFIKDWLAGGCWILAVGASTLCSPLRQLCKLTTRFFFFKAVVSLLVSLLKIAVMAYGIYSYHDGTSSVTALTKYVSILNIIDEVGQRHTQNALQIVRRDEWVWLASVEWIKAWIKSLLGL